MFLNVMKVRAVLAVAGLVVLVGYLAMGGSFGGKSSIVIEFGMYPEEFTGCEVEIDGKVVGKLQKFGQATRNAFKVKDGKHTVRIVHPEIASAEITVDTGVGARQAMVILDFQNRYVNGKDEVLIAAQ